MNCNKYDNKLEELNKYLKELNTNDNGPSYEVISELACLLCRNSTMETSNIAMSIFEKLVVDAPYNALYWFGLARICHVLNIFERADEAYIKATRLSPLDTRFLERAARFFSLTCQVDKALYYCNRLVDIDLAKQELCNRLMSEVYYNCAMYDKALFCFEQGVGKQNNNYYTMIIESYYVTRQYGKTIDLAEEMLTDNCENKVKILDILAQAYFSSKEYEKAAGILEQLVVVDRDKYIHDLASTYSNIGNFNDALVLFEEVISISGNSELALSNYALTLYKQDRIGNYAKIKDIYLNILLINPQQVTITENLGMICYENGDFKEAVQFLSNAYKLDNSHIGALKQAVVSSISCQDYNSGILYGLQVCSEKSASAIDYCNLGWCYEQTGNYKQAAQYILAAIEKDPGNSLYLSNFADILTLQRDYSKALLYFEKALAVDKNSPYIWDGYGNVLLALENYDKAIEAYSKALELNKNDMAINQLGWAYYKKKDYDKSIILFLEAIELSIDLKRGYEEKYKNNLFFAYADKDDFIGLIDLLNNRKDLFSDPFSYLTAASIYIQLGEGEKATKMYELIGLDQYSKDYIDCSMAFAIFNSNDPMRHIKIIDLLSKVDLYNPLNVLLREDALRCLGLSFMATNDTDNAIKTFKEAVEIGKSNAINWNNLCIAYLQINDFEEAAKAFQEALSCDNISQCGYLNYVYDKAPNTALIEKCKMFSCLLKITDSINIIKRILRYTPEKSVYHYTKLSVLKELIKTDFENDNYPKLRMYNSAHMNDPLEGSVFDKLVPIPVDDGKCLTKTTDSLPINGVFLASFCETGDSLPLWVQYASNGEGCSIEISAEFFDAVDNDFLQNIYRVQEKEYVEDYSFASYAAKQVNDAKDFSTTLIDTNNVGNNGNIIESILSVVDNIFADTYFIKYFDFFKKIMSINQNKANGEKYCLYKVCYIDGPDNFINLSDIESESIKSELKKIVKLIAGINDDSSISTDAKRIIWQITDETLSQIKYLFKSKDYQHEQEVRLIKFESLHSKSVKRFEQAEVFPSLYTEIERPLHFSKIILGPRVDRPSKIVPAMYKGKVIDEVVLSSIKYQ